MKTLTILAALLMASPAAHAGNSISFDIEGHHIHVAVPRNCDSLSCLQISAPGLSGSISASSRSTAMTTTITPTIRRAYRCTSTAPAAPADRTEYCRAAVVAASRARRSNRCSGSPRLPRPPTPLLFTQPPAPAVAAVSPVPVVAAARLRRRLRLQQYPHRTRTARFGVPGPPKKTRVTFRIEPCGVNLCGYAVKTGEKILIGMKPSGSKWTGQDSRSGLRAAITTRRSR